MNKMMGAAFDRKAATRSSRALRLLLVAGAATVLSTPAWAQTMLQPPSLSVIDANGVELLQGNLSMRVPGISAGDENSGISVSSTGFNLPFGDNHSSGINSSKYTDNFDELTVMAVSYGGSTEGFERENASSPWVSKQSQGGSFSCAGTTCTYVRADGAVVLYDTTKRSTLGLAANRGVAYQVTKPDGEIIKLYYKSSGALSSVMATLTYRLTFQSQSLVGVSSSLGWMVKYETALLPAGYRPTKIYIINSSKNYCDPSVSSLTCTASNAASWPTLNIGYSGQEFLYSDGAGVFLGALSAMLYSSAGLEPSALAKIRLTGYRMPSGISYVADTGDDWTDPVEKVVARGQTWNYSQSFGPSTSTDGVMNATVTNPYGYTKIVKRLTPIPGLIDIPVILLGEVKDENGLISTYQYYNSTDYSVGAVKYKLKRQITPDASYSGATLTGGYSDYTYDARGNVTSITTYPRGGGTPKVEAAGFPASCDATNSKFCNKPVWSKDARSNQTDYTYATEHGGLLTETGPADANGVRPQKRNTYALLYPMVQNANGALVASTPVWRLTSTSTCKVATAGNPASCVGSADEVVTSYEYGTNNLQLTAVTVRAGNASAASPSTSGNLWQTISYGYDDNGNQVWVDGPLPGAEDRAYVTYDAMRRKVFEIGPDPDGSGERPRVVVKHSYDADGREYLTQSGSGNAVDGSDFAPATFKRTSYDPTTGLAIKIEEGGA
ncbi:MULTISPECIES: hypothetical protein [unclassified Caulobacter]|uniref:hypothetical protein n=1 Tax=unclassified Caulobacter TaxID=2648921 RepID=UPI0011B452AE|nr:MULTISPECIES: hypothetical protein [unclassified Caulobacter]